MPNKLYDYEWRYLLQMTVRICECNSYEELSKTFLEQIRVMIPFDKGVVFRARRNGASAVISSPVSLGYGNSSRIVGSFLRGRYPHWDKAVMEPRSGIYRQSDVIDEKSWEKSRIYDESWGPQNIHWGLNTTIISNDVPLVIIGFYRSKKEDDFSERDIFIMQLFINVLENLYMKFLGGSRDAPEKSEIFRKTSVYRLTRQESEIVYLLCQALSSEEICSRLYISNSTLSKHLSNIYRKTGVHDRVALVSMFIG